MELVERTTDNPITIKFSNDFNTAAIMKKDSEDGITVDAAKLEQVAYNIIMQKNLNKNGAPEIIDEKQNVSLALNAACNQIIFNFGKYVKLYESADFIVLWAYVMSTRRIGLKVYDEMISRVNAKTLKPEALDDTKYIGEMCLKYESLWKKTMEPLNNINTLLSEKWKLPANITRALLSIHWRICNVIIKIEKLFKCNHLDNKCGEGRMKIVMDETFSGTKYAIT